MAAEDPVMKLGRLFGGKKAAPDPSEPPQKSPGLGEFTAGYIQAHADELYEKQKAGIGLDENRKAELDALAFVIHTLDSQDGITAKAKDIEYSFLDPKGLWFTLAVECGDAKADIKYKLFLYPYRAGPIMLQRGGPLTNQPSHDFMTYDGRKTVFDAVAAYLTYNKITQRSARLREGYYEQALLGRKTPSAKPSSPEADNPAPATPKP